MQSSTRAVRLACYAACIFLIGCGQKSPQVVQDAPAEQPAPPVAQQADPGDPVERAFQQLRTPEGKVEYLFSVNPGGPVFEFSAPMRELVEQGSSVQPRLLAALKDPQVRNEAALILARVGDKDALPRLIELLPAVTENKQTEEEKLSTTCLLYALWQITGLELGIHHKFSPSYTPEFKTQWQAWHEANKDYLYTPAEPKLTSYRWAGDRVLIDVEARLAGQPTKAFRKEHPWITYEEIKNWRDDPAYVQQLKDYCLSTLVQLCWNPHGNFSIQALRALGRVRDPRALSALHTLCGLADMDSGVTYDLIRALSDRGDTSSIPFLEKIPRSTVKQEAGRSNEAKRQAALERLRLLKRHSNGLADPRGAEQLIADMRELEGRDYFLAYFLASYTYIAGYVDRDPLLAFLRERVRAESTPERARTLYHSALAMHGQKDSLDYLKKALAHKEPGVRLAAAAGLWHLGRRDGLPALIELTRLGPLETGREGVSSGNGVIVKVEAVSGSNLEIVRQACRLLGEMGDRSAVEPLKRLLPLNLNGVLATGGSGSGWSGRPDAVALAKLGDFSGIAVLRASIQKGDPLGVVNDFAEIGLKRFIPEVFPLFGQQEENKRAQAAETVLALIESGR